MARWRTREAIAPTVAEEAGDPVYRRLWQPMLVLQLAHYTWVLPHVLLDPTYAAVPGDDPSVHENHLGLLIQLVRQPHAGVLGVHMVMAWAWIAVVLVQKRLAAAMAGDGFARARRVHAAIGTAMLALGFVGIAIAPVLALADRVHNPATTYLVGLLAFFLPAFGMTAVTARRKDVSVRWHRFWAEITFVGPALSSLWSEVAIYVLGRTGLGPYGGEMVGTQLAAVLGLALVVVPAWRSLRRGLAADAAPRVAAQAA